MKGITLIGMPGAGKTTTGPVLAKILKWPLYDIDSMIGGKEHFLIEEILTGSGDEYLGQLEMACVSEHDLHDTVLVTPGSIIYDTACHDQLKRQTIIFWLDYPLDIIKIRLAKRSADELRGIVNLAEEGLEQLYIERGPMYQSLANVRIECEGRSPEDIAREVITRAKIIEEE